MPTPHSTPRSLALTTLLSVEKGKYGNIVVDTTLKRANLSEIDRHFYTALVYGVIERKTTLEFLVERFSDRPLSELNEVVRMALCMGLYQLVYMDRIPDHAALSETVALMSRKAAGYVNAVLRSYLRFEVSLTRLTDKVTTPREKALTTPEQWIARFPELGEGDFTAMSVCYGIPVSLCETFVSALGWERAEAALRGFGEKPPITVRVNTQKTAADALAAELTAARLTVLPPLYADTALRIPEGAVTATEAFVRGDFFVQDEASQLCVAALDAHPGDVVVDTCACPGSKSFGIALSMENKGEIHAFDLHKSKLSLIVSGAARLGLTIVTPDERDARNPDPALLGKCDRVLCDVPCSGLGVIAKKPEIRHKDLTESARLPGIQAAILEASAGYLKSGGVLVYSTCTVLPAENEDVVKAFLATHPEFEPYDFTFPAKDRTVSDIVSEGGMVTLLPDTNRTDGFFIARLRRK